MYKLKVIIIHILLYYCCSYVIVAEDTLQQVHVVFRHGDRTPDAGTLYPKDPHINDTFYPDGLGALTMLGKMQEYKIGKALRKKYNKFLGDIYTPDVLEARSTDYNRTKMSLELALAGLWPPAASQMWNTELLWLPIPYNYYSAEQDALLRYPIDTCPRYTEIYDKVEQSDQFQYFFIKNNETIQYINENSGLHITRAEDIANLFFALKSEEETGRQLPDWTIKVWPEFMEAGIKLWYEIQTYNDDLLQAIGGRMIQQVLEDANAKIDGAPVPKIHLYSGHEYNIAHVLASLKAFKPHVPPYASYIMIELHKIDGQYGFQIFYQDYTTKDAHLMQIPGCDEFCPIDKFEELHESILVGDDPSC